MFSVVEPESGSRAISPHTVRLDRGALTPYTTCTFPIPTPNPMPMETGNKQNAK